MKTKISTLITLIVIAGTMLYGANQGTRDSSYFNNNGAGIPNSGNTLYPNNGPEFPHSAPLNPTTDPGPLFHGPSGITYDSIPDPQKGSHPQQNIRYAVSAG